MSVQDAAQQNKHLKGRIETLQKQWELDEAAVKQTSERQVEKWQESIAGHQGNIAAVSAKLQNSDQALYGWLNKNQPGWEVSIGKVCREDVLFSDQLSPKLQPSASQSFYGVDINLGEINLSVKTLAEYEAEKTEAEKEIATAQKAAIQCTK